jgi:hypothetical protein
MDLERTNQGLFPALACTLLLKVVDCTKAGATIYSATRTNGGNDSSTKQHALTMAVGQTLMYRAPAEHTAASATDMPVRIGIGVVEVLARKRELWEGSDYIGRPGWLSKDVMLESE